MKKAIIVLITLVVFGGLLVFGVNRVNKKVIDFFTLETHSGFNDIIKNTKYQITSKAELEIFKELYEGFKLSEEYDLSKNTIFVQTQVYSSGSDTAYFKSVQIDNEIKFDIINNFPEMGTTDMVYRYFVAVIPNSALKTTNIKEWKKPSDVKDSQKSEYTIEIKNSKLSFTDSINIVENTVNSVGNIKIKNYVKDLSSNNAGVYVLTSYDEKSCNRLIENINNMKNGLEAKLNSMTIKDETEYIEFKNTLDKKATKYIQIFLYSNFHMSESIVWGITSEKGKEISEMLKADEIIKNRDGELNVKYNSLDIEQMEKNLNIINNNKEEWDLRQYFVHVFWEY